MVVLFHHSKSSPPSSSEKEKGRGKMNRRIVQTANDYSDSHRKDFETCPHCDHRMKHGEWDKLADTLVLTPRCFRVGCVSVMAECPKCFKKSWVHVKYYRIEIDDDLPQKWRDTVAALDKSTKLTALRDWGSSICHRCQHLKGGIVEYHAWRQCKIGSGPAETECETFAELTPTPKPRDRKGERG